MTITHATDLLEKLNQFVAQSTLTRTLSDLAKLVQGILDELIACEYSGLYLLDETTNRLKLHFAKGFSEEERLEAERTAMDRHPGWVIRTGELLHIPDTEKDFKQRSKTSVRSFQVRSRLFIPVRNGNKVVGTFGLVSSRVNPFSTEDINVLEVVSNITGAVYGNIIYRNQAETTASRLSTLILNLGDGILLENENREIVLINQAFCDLFHIPLQPESMKGADCALAAEQSKGLFVDPHQFITRVDEILSRKLPVNNEECAMVDGKVLLRNYLPIFLGEKFLGNLWQYSDITKIKQKEAELRKAKQEAETGNKAKSQFVANMSHEIRTPLNAIYGIIKLLEETPLSPEQKKLVRGLSNSSEGLLGIVNDVLDFSKIEAGELSLEELPFNPCNLIQSTLHLLEFKSAERNNQLVHTLDPKICQTLVGDNQRLRQILLNLINNAIKFTKNGTITISAHAVEEDQKRISIEFKVSDTGIGISSENLERIFQSFQQEDSSVARNYGGTGLGLAISKQLVNLMGGSLKVKSQKNEGSLFYFTLEFKKNQEIEVKSSENKVALDPTLLQGLRILLVEDNEFNQFIAKSLIEKWGCVVTQAGNGVEALYKLSSESFDIVLMDLQMPVMGGLEATLKIREELKSDVPVVALTANVVKEVLDLCKAAGMNDFITKPFNPTNLKEKLIILSQSRKSSTLKSPFL